MEKHRLLFNTLQKLPAILQDERAECGHACIAMISNYWGHELDLYSLRKLSPASMRGVNLAQIKGIFSTLGFKTRALRVSLQELSFVKLPAIVHWNMNHFVVLKSFKKNGFVVHDPARGVVKCSVEQFSNSFTGVVLEVEKDVGFEKISASSTLSLGNIVSTINGIKPYLAVLLALSLAIEILSLANPLFMQYLTDEVIGANDTANLYRLIIGFALIIALHVFTDFIRGNMVVYLSTNLSEQFASNVVKHLLKLPMDFFEKRHKGDIQSKFYSVEDIQKKLSTDFINTLLDGLMVIVNLSVMLLYSGVLTGLVCSSLLLYYGIRYASFRTLKKTSEKSVLERAQASSVFLEILQAILPIKSFAQEESRFNLWKNSYVKFLNADVQTSRILIFYNAINQLLFQAELLIVLTVGAFLVMHHVFSIGMLLAFLSYRLSLVTKASSLIQNIFDYKLIAIQLNRLSDIVFQHPENIPAGMGCDKNTKGALRVQNLQFTYHPNDKPIISNISFCIKAGEKVAFVGPSGCGKTTFLKVIMGLLEKTAGEIYIDEVPLQCYGLKNYRQNIASVLQDDALLSGSILNNIAFFDEEIDMERVYRVAKLAAIDDHIQQLPMGYETSIGDMGSTLSGGQKQRILLARALYKQPKILFLDEATSHLDKDNEKIINESLKSLAITQIIIAHRQETIQMADRVLYFNELNAPE